MIPKFRAWHNELGRMMSIKYMWFQENCLEELELNDEIMNDYIIAYPDEIELMQSTGLHDKNGKEIFEGDILKVANNDSSWFEVVKYDHDKAMFISKEVNLKYEVSETPLYDLFSPYLFKVEVIGNIWEDGDLIDGKKANEN